MPTLIATDGEVGAVRRANGSITASITASGSIIVRAILKAYLARHLDRAGKANQVARLLATELRPFALGTILNAAPRQPAPEGCRAAARLQWGELIVTPGRQMGLDARQVDGACHCGTVRFRATLTDGLRTVRRCNCSFCRMRGAVAVSAPLDGLAITAGADALSTYQFNTGTARHYFCSVCGIYTHHRRRSDPNQYGINVACLEGVSPFDFAEIPVNDGASHPADGPGGYRLAGVLRFIRADP